MLFDAHLWLPGAAIYISVCVCVVCGEGEAVHFFSEMSNLCNSWETADADSLASFKEVIAYLCGIEEYSHLN